MYGIKRSVLVGPFNVDNLSASHADIVASFPMPTAIAGFGYKFCLDMTRHLDVDISHRGTAVIIHESSVFEGHCKVPVETRANTSGAGIIIDELKARGVVSLIVNIQVNADVDDDAIGEYLKSGAISLNFAGGRMFPVDGLHDIQCVLFRDELELIKGIGSLQPGFLLIDRHDIIMDIMKTGKDSLDAMLDVFEMFSDPEDGNGTLIRRHRGWFIPTIVGYQAIERPKPRKNLRNPEISSHVYAESLYSVAEFKSTRSLVKNSPEILSRAFWKHFYAPETETYFVSPTH